MRRLLDWPHLPVRQTSAALNEAAICADDRSMAFVAASICGPILFNRLSRGNILQRSNELCRARSYRLAGSPSIGQKSPKHHRSVRSLRYFWYPNEARSILFGSVLGPTTDLSHHDSCSGASCPSGYLYLTAVAKTRVCAAFYGNSRK